MHLTLCILKRSHEVPGSEYIPYYFYFYSNERLPVPSTSKTFCYCYPLCYSPTLKLRNKYIHQTLEHKNLRLFTTGNQNKHKENQENYRLGTQLVVQTFTKTNKKTAKKQGYLSLLCNENLFISVCIFMTIYKSNIIGH